MVLGKDRLWGELCRTSHTLAHPAIHQLLSLAMQEYTHRAVHVWPEGTGEAKPERIAAQPIRLVNVAPVIGIRICNSLATVDDLVCAAAGTEIFVDSCFVLRLVDGLDAVCVVVSHFQVGDHLHGHVDGAVNNAELHLSLVSIFMAERLKV